MKKIFLLSLFLLLGHINWAQKKRVDSILAKMDQATSIQSLAPIMDELLATPKGDFALLKKGKQYLADAQASDNLIKQQWALGMICKAAFSLHDTPELLNASLMGIQVSRNLSDNKLLGDFLHGAGLANTYQHEIHKGLSYTLMAANAHKAAGDIRAELNDYSNIESSYVDLKMPDSALVIANLEVAILKKIDKTKPDYWNAYRIATGDLGEALAYGGRPDSALVYYIKSYQVVKMSGENIADFPYLINNLAKTYLVLGKRDSAAKYGLESYGLASKTRLWEFTGDAASILSKVYEGRDDKKSLYYLKAQLAANDSINASDRAKQFQLITEKERQRNDDLKTEKERLNARMRLYIVIGAAIILLIIGLILWRNNKKQKHTNQLLSEQKEEISAQRDNLEHQNHELEIEAALERVRTVAMGMSDADDMLEVCKTISLQLELLGLKEIRNVQTAIFYGERGTYMNYEHYARHDKNIVTETSYVNNEKHAEFAEKMQKGYGQFFELHIPHTELKDWLGYQKTTNVFIDAHLENAASLNYYWYSLATVALGISTYVPLTGEEKSLFTRFLKVFELSYKRYLDIKKAEEQAREARIQTALERVRAAAMAMKKSEEVLGVCEVMYTELLALGFTNIRNAQVAIKSQNKQSYLICVYSPSESVTLQEAPFGSPIVKELFDELEKSKDAFYQREFSGQKFEDWRKWRESLLPLTDVEAGAASLCFYLYSIGIGHLGISTYNPITAEQVEILRRFKKVFELAYTRYTDVAQAEAQARESQIQLALERVRARTMAMQRSEELAETVFVLFQQFKELGENPDQATIGIINEEERVIDYWVTMHGNQNEKVYKFSIDEPNVTRKIYDAWKAQKSSLVIDLSGQPLQDFMEYRASMGGAPAKPDEKRRIINVAIFSKGLINVQSTAERSEESITLLERFAQVFEQTYTRFLDLKKAEKQARQAQIEVAMEKVRSRSLAMQKPGELVEVAQLLRQEMALLGVEELETSSIYIHHEESGETECWYAIKDEHKLVADHMDINLKDTWVGEQMLKFYHSDKNQVSIVMQGVNRKEWINYCSKQSKLLEGFYGDNIPDRTYHLCKFSGGYMGAASPGEISAESWDLLQSATAVFSFAYTRFSDLQQAEAQAREAKIEVALERTRTQSIIMQHSSELDDTLRVFHEQVLHLGINSAFSFLWLPDEEKDRHIFWAAWAEDDSKVFKSKAIDYPLDRNEPATAQCLVDWKGKEPVVSYHVPPEGVESYFAAWQELIYGVENLRPDHFRAGLHYVEAFMKYGCFGVIVKIPLSDEEKKILARFAIEFERTYTRFLDLQKAEAQAREAQIEAALERVRSRTMAMHNSKDIADTSVAMFQELVMLGVESSVRCGVAIISGVNELEVWTASLKEDGGIKLNIGQLSMTAHPLLLHVFNSWKDNESSTRYNLNGDAVRSYFQVLNDSPGYPFQYPMDSLPEKWGINAFFFKEGCLFAFTGEPLSLEMSQLFKRFAGVFGQTYTRFLDLQKAEAQAREAEIQLALERIRARTTAMQKSEELHEVIQVVFDQLHQLHFAIDNANFILNYQETDDLDLWLAVANGQYPTKINIPYLEHPAFDRFNKAKEKGGLYADTLSLEEKNSFFEHFFKHLPNVPDERKTLIFSQPGFARSAVFMKNTALAINNYQGIPYSEIENNILLRFGHVFDETYTRFNDLKQAEAQAREAKIEAALEKVRSRTLAMQKSDELAETAAVLFRQMISLGIEPNRLYIGITKEDSSEIEFWITDEDGSKVSNMFTGDADKNKSMKKMRDAWKAHKKSIVIDMQSDELTEYFHYLGDILNVPFKGGLTQKRRVQYISYFSNGFIGMASPDDQPSDTVELLDRFSYVFNLTFARFNDLKIAEKHAIQAEQDLVAIKAAKQRAEDTLTELRAAQKQLVQSEKMASLGELTAGIAHEIQNPLNFVNNFSEVSAELIDEMTEELDKGDIEEVKAIAGDIRDNLEKIRHHGKRADGIVKGMLQHSRTSSGQKEPTDLNALADEYLRLSYHGLRAKDKSFNAELVTHFDKALPKVSVVPQDMGRVILNLINNAFYATQQKQKNAGSDYKPTVEVKTWLSGDQALISVKDNGIGIPDAIKEKIMQPFFTTKPTGEGTGLGLSLSYDIVVKSHGGNVLINSAEGNGSEFIVNLPLKS